MLMGGLGGAWSGDARAGGARCVVWGENHTNRVDGDVAHHASANCQLRTAGGRGGERPKAKCFLSPDKTRLLAGKKRQVCPVTNAAYRPAHLKSAKNGQRAITTGAPYGGQLTGR